MAQPGHPQSHLWAALKRRFADQTRPSTAPNRLLRALCITPLEGQEESAAFTLGYREIGSVLRTVSLSRDFSAVQAMVEPEQPCYIAVFVGDVQHQQPQPQLQPPPPHVPQQDWVLIAYVPSTCSSFEAKKMADGRVGLRESLGAEAFVSVGMWCVSPEQITLSNYMRSMDGASADSAGALSPDRAARQELAASKIQGVIRRKSQSTDDAQLPPMPPPIVFSRGAAASDPTEAIWEERMKGMRYAYVDACKRLVGQLEELEQTLCGLTGDEYRQDEPLLHARAHLAKNLDSLARA